MKIDLQDISNPKSDFQASYDGYFALELRRKLQSEEDDLIPLSNAYNRTNSWDCEGFKELAKPLTIKCKEIEMELTAAEDLLYIQPVFVNYHSENPFKSESRDYPIDFGYTFNEFYKVELRLPEDYVLDEVPEPQLIKLPNQYGNLQYQIAVKDRTATVMARFRINKPVIGQGLYPQLKEFYDNIIAKLNAQLVLRRI